VLDQAVNEARKHILQDNNDIFWADQEKIVPWDIEVDGEDILNALTSTVKRFIVCDDEYAKAVALWIVHTWAIGYSNIAPILMITAPEKRCGKTVLLEFIGKLSLKPLTASSISSSSIYRLVEQVQPTLCIDEADTFLKSNEALRGVINSGHTRSSANVILTDPNTLEVRPFSTFCCKAIAGIGVYADTIMDRSIIVKLRRKLPHESVEKLRFADQELFITLKSKILRWVNDHADELANARPKTVYELNDRAADSWEPLFAIADAAGSEWSKIAREISLKISGENETQSITTELLSDVREAFAVKRTDRLSTAELLDALFEDEEKPWKTWNRGFEMKSHQLSKKLSEYGIKSKDMRFGGHGVLKGYSLDMFADVFKRYLDDPILMQNELTNSILNNEASNDIRYASLDEEFDELWGTLDDDLEYEYQKILYYSPIDVWGWGYNNYHTEPENPLDDPDYIDYQNSLTNDDDDEFEDWDDPLMSHTN
jgi:putative DNA primase/helicase